MKDSPKTNVLLIMTDQHRLSALGAYGETPCQTPNLDSLAGEGVLFDNAYTSCPVCSPARASIMTGHYPHKHGILTNIHETACSVHELEDRPELLSRRLENAGYNCGYTGKWHLGTNRDRTYFNTSNTSSVPSLLGFEGQDFPGHGGGGFMYQEYKDYLKENGFEHKVLEWSESTREIWPMGILEGAEESTVPYFLVEHTIKLLEKYREDSKPFFISHNFWGPHGPFYVPREFLDIYRDVEIPEWPNYDWAAMDIIGPHQNKVHPHYSELSWEDWATALRYYYAFTTLIDKQIGRLMDYMRDTGLLDNTFTIFSADHGQTLGSHGGLVDKGWHHFEETNKIPLILRLPDGKHAGRRESNFASTVDIYSTILDVAGVENPNNETHGLSLLPLLDNPDTAWRSCVVTEFNGLANAGTTMRTLRWKHYKYGYNVVGKDEVYDLKNDPHEKENLIDSPEYIEAKHIMQDLLLEWMGEHDDRAINRFKLKYSRERKIECAVTT